MIGIDDVLARLDRHDEVIVGVTIGAAIHARAFSASQLALDDTLAQAQSLPREFEDLAVARRWIEQHAAEDWRRQARKIALGKADEDRFWWLKPRPDPARAWLNRVGPERYVATAHEVLGLNVATLRGVMDADRPRLWLGCRGLEALGVAGFRLLLAFPDGRARDRFVRDAPAHEIWLRFVRERLSDDLWILGVKPLSLDDRLWYRRMDLGEWGAKIL